MKIKIILILVLNFTGSRLLATENNPQAGQPGQILEQGRLLFYQSVESKAPIEPAIALFQFLSEEAEFSARARTYIGALEALKGKHATFPHQKLKWVQQGLIKMDRGILDAPDDIEARFIRATTCFYLPFFFGRKEQAQADFKQIVKLLPENFALYPPALMLNVIRFLQAHYALTKAEIDALNRVKQQLETNAN